MSIAGLPLRHFEMAAADRKVEYYLPVQVRYCQQFTSEKAYFYAGRRLETFFKKYLDS
jgi:hypothetical protein